MSMKPFLSASTLAIVLSVAAAPARAQFYSGGSSVVVGGPTSFVTVGGPTLVPTTVVSPMVSPYPYVVPTTTRVLVQPAPMLMTQPYGYTVYRPIPRPYGVYYAPRVYRVGRGRRGWW